MTHPNPDNQCLRCGLYGHTSDECKQPWFTRLIAKP